MTSTPPLKDSKRRHFGKAIRRGFDEFKHALLSPSLSSRDPGNLTAQSRAAASSASSATSSWLAAAQLASPEKINPTTQSAGSLTLSDSSAPTTKHVMPTASPEPNTTDKLKGAGSVVWSRLETALRVLEKSADMFPPLKSAVGGFVGCLDIVQEAVANAEDYEELTSELTAVASTLNQYLSELGSEDPNGSATRIALSLEAEVKQIEKRQGRGKGRRMIESTQDKEDVIKRYRRVEGLFRQLQGDIGLRTWRNTNEHHVTTLLRGMSPVDDARYNSTYSTAIKRRGCTAETREKVQADLQGWVQDPNAAQVYWMNGMAGTGKTTIAYSLCEWLEANQRLGANFFCSRVSSSCCNVNLIVPTIAYQLARYSPAFQSALCKILKDNPDVSKLNVVKQFEKLMREPMLMIKDAMPEGVVVVIDALDECEDDYGVRLVLGTLLRLGVDLPLKFFVSSRPEPATRDNMLSSGRYSPAMVHLHDIEQSIVEGDIKKYLIEALGSMSPAPSDGQIEQLAKRAGKLFIYAATVVRYILPGKGSANPIARLSTMLRRDSQSPDKEQSSKKYKHLDDLYTTILASAFDDEELETKELESMQLVLRTAVCAKEPMTALTMAPLLGLTEEETSYALQPLRSVLHVSEANGLISILHASFSDYIFDRRRSGDFFCDKIHHSELLANRCFDVMKGQLRFNICGLESSFIFDKDVPDLEQRIKTCISHTLYYACRYWGEHLQLAGASDTLHEKLADFLTHRLLLWIEVLNLKQCIARGIPILAQAEKWISFARVSAGTYKQAADARDFITRFAASACSRSTPHLYLSALPFSSKSNSVYARYWERMEGLMDVKGTALSQRDKAAQATWVTGSNILSVSVSSDGTWIVSGSSDRTLRVWDARTGDAVAGPFKGHTGPVRSTVFSPDDARIASCSNDRTIRVWDTLTGNIIAGPFNGHTDWVNSVGFSFDGTRLVSGSSDRTIRVWGSRTGETIAGPFEGHMGWVRSVAFSPDDIRIVSGSDDHTTRVWDVTTGETIAGPFEGHKDRVISVAFSPDGARIASSSDDRTTILWDARTGHIVTGPLEGHTDRVNSVMSLPMAHVLSLALMTGQCYVIAGPFRGHTSSVNSVGFSPDGTRIFSGSSDMTIRTWNASTDNNVAGSFKGHTDSINSVAFSPDGAHVVSGSGDQTIRVWNSCTGDIVAGPFNGHSASVISVGFSPDGTHIVSASSDRTLRVWDARTGDTIVGPLKRPTDKVRSVGFSPDGTRIVSGSHETIQIWDARTGDTIIGLPGYIEPRFHVRWHPGSGPEFVWDSETDLGSGSGSDYQATHTPDEANIASGSDDETIRAWDLHTSDTIVETLQVHTDSDPNLDSALGSDCPWPAPFSLDHFRIFRKPYPATILVPYAQTSSESDGEIIGVLGDTIEPLQVHKDSGSSLDSDPDYRAPSLPDGTHVVSSSGYRNVCFAESISIREIEESGSDPDSELDSGPDLGLRDLIWDQRWGFDYWAAFSPDGTRILSGSDDGTIQVRDAHTGNTIAGPFQVHMGSGPGSDSGSDSGSDTGSEFDYWAAFSPDGTRIVSGSGGRSVRVCDAYTGSTIAGPFKGHTYLVSSAAFSPDNTHVVCGSDDGTIRVWDAHTGDIIAGPFEGHTGSVNSVAFSPDGARIVSGSSDQTIRVWAVRVGGTVGGPSERLPGTANSVGPSFDGTRVISNSYNDQDDFLSDASLLIPNPVQQAPIRGALVGTKDLNRCNDGWVTAANNTPLFWVPPDLQSLMPHPHNTLVIGSQGSVHLIYRKLKLGERWAQCYTPC